MRRFTAFLQILACLASTTAAPRPDKLTKRFVGAWRLLSIDGIAPGRTGVYDRPKSSKIGLDFPFSAGIVNPKGNYTSGERKVRTDFGGFGPVIDASAAGRNPVDRKQSPSANKPLRKLVRTRCGGCGGEASENLEERSESSHEKSP